MISPDFHRFIETMYEHQNGQRLAGNEPYSINPLTVFGYVVKMFSSPHSPHPAQRGMTPTWTIAMEFWGSLGVYTLAASSLPVKNKLVLPVAVFIASKWTNSWFCLFIAGYIIAYLKIQGGINSEIRSMDKSEVLHPVSTLPNTSGKQELNRELLSADKNELLHHKDSEYDSELRKGEREYQSIPLQTGSGLPSHQQVRHYHTSSTHP